jgi:tetratricopeptide (TPR) repeat protein
MKRLILLLLLISTSLFARQADSLFVKANKLYQNEKYDEALILYKQIEENKLVSDELYYNIANANYKLNKIAPAIYYYEKALLLNPHNDDARFNLNFAQQMAIDNIEPLPKNLSRKFSDNIIQQLTFDTWAWLAVSFSLLFAILFLLYHFSYSPYKKRLFFISSFTSAFFALITLVFAFQNRSYLKANRQAIVYVQETQIKSAPTMSSEVIFELHEGTKVQILENLDNWDKIKIADGKIGWIPADDLKEIR